MRVLVIGSEVSDFMCPVFAKLRSEHDIKVDLFEMRPQEQIRKQAFTAFDNVLDISLKISNYSAGHKLASICSGYFVKRLLQGDSIKNAMRNAILHKKLQPIISGYDAVHLCFITHQLFSFYDAIASAKKLVMTWWGSDILQNNENFSYIKQEKLVRIADKVTTHQREMKELFLSKFGRVYEDKVSEMLLVSDTAYMKTFANAIPDREKYIASFKKRYGIATHKRLVVVGHSGHDIDNHIPIINAIAPYKGQVVDRICVVLPMTYGCTEPVYFDEVANACKAMGVEYVLMNTFLSTEELHELRMASEILLRLSTADAFSLSLCETICAGNMLVAGTWLPYSKLNGNGVYFEEIYDINKVGGLLVDILDNYDTYLQRCSHNAQRVIEIFEEENTSEKLYNIYTK